MLSKIKESKNEEPNSTEEFDLKFQIGTFYSSFSFLI